jgi:hypothetical protein
MLFYKPEKVDYSIYKRLSYMGVKCKWWWRMPFLTDFILLYKFKVCKSVHHHTIQINNQLDATVFQFIILTFIYSSACSRRPHAPHRKLNNCSSSLWFYRWSVVTAVLLVMVGPTGPTTTNSPAITTLQR